MSEPTEVGSYVRGRLGRGGVGAAWRRTGNSAQPWKSTRTGRLAAWTDLVDVEAVSPQESARWAMWDDAMLADPTGMDRVTRDGDEEGQ